MLKVLFFYKEREAQSKIQEEFLRTIEALFKGKIEVERLDVGKNERTVKEYSVKEIPTIVIEKDGRVTDRFVGFTQELFLKRALERNL